MLKQMERPRRSRPRVRSTHQDHTQWYTDCLDSTLNMTLRTHVHQICDIVALSRFPVYTYTHTDHPWSTCHTQTTLDPPVNQYSSYLCTYFCWLHLQIAWRLTTKHGMVVSHGVNSWPTARLNTGGVRIRVNPNGKCCRCDNGGVLGRDRGT